MPTLIQTTHGKVIAMQGSALIRGADGKMRALHVGDIVERGDVILTTQNGGTARVLQDLLHHAA